LKKRLFYVIEEDFFRCTAGVIAIVLTISTEDAEDCNDCSVGFGEKAADFCLKDGHEKAPNTITIWSFPAVRAYKALYPYLFKHSQATDTGGFFYSYKNEYKRDSPLQGN